MSRIDELKKQHPLYALSAIDIYKMISPDQTNKYVEMLIKLDKNIKHDYPGDHRARLIDEMANGWGLDYNYLETLDLETLLFLANSVNTLLQGQIRTFTKFASYNERKLIGNSDVTSYSSWEEIENAVSLADVKMLDKKLEKQIKKVYEDDTWISLRPLSLEASMKYGANTKWCTTTESGQYYARYSDRGILIYNINKKTGYKVACFKNIDPNHDNEFSWWDVTDRRIEALDSEAPSVVLEAVRNEIKNFSIPNKTLMAEEESMKLEFYKDGLKIRSTIDSGIGVGHVHISGGLSTYTTGTTVDYNPSTFTTTADNVIRFTSSGNVGIGTINPSAQLQVNGNLEIDGDVILRSDGEERARLTPDGFRFSATQESLNEDLERRLFADITRDYNDEDRIAADAQQRLDDAMAEQMAEANERVAKKHLSLLDNIELGTLDHDIKLKMQLLAGIKTTSQRIQEMEAEIEQLRSEEAQPEVVHSSIWNKIKNTGKKLSRTFTSRSRKRIGVSPKSVSARLEAVKRSQEQ